MSEQYFTKRQNNLRTLFSKENLSSKKIFYDALRRLNPSLSIKAPKLQKQFVKNLQTKQKKMQ